MITRSPSFMVRASLLCALTLFAANAAVITGPTLTQNEVGHTGHGIIFEALQNVDLVGFHFSNQGKADVIQLYDTTAALMVGTYNIAAGNPALDITVDWSLTSGHIYNLIGTTTSNGMWSSFEGFPLANTDIRITSGYFSGPYSTAWGDFNNIATGEGAPGQVPEPSTFALLAGALALLGARRLRA